MTGWVWRAGTEGKQRWQGRACEWIYSLHVTWVWKHHLFNESCLDSSVCLCLLLPLRCYEYRCSLCYENQWVVLACFFFLLMIFFLLVSAFLQGPPGPVGSQGPPGQPGPHVSIMKSAIPHMLWCKRVSDVTSSCRVLMESQVPEVSRVCLGRRETRAHEASQDHPDPSAFRWELQRLVSACLKHSTFSIFDGLS